MCAIGTGRGRSPIYAYTCAVERKANLGRRFTDYFLLKKVPTYQDVCSLTYFVTTAVGTHPAQMNPTTPTEN